MESQTTEYVSQKIFDLQLEDIKYRTNSERERVDDRLDKNQAVIDKNMAEVKSMFVEIRAEIRMLDKKIDNVDEKLTASIQNTNNRITGLEKRFEDMKDYQNKWFVVLGGLLGILTLAFSVIAFFKG